MENFKLTINTPKGKTYDAEVNVVTFKSKFEQLTILANHSNVTGVIEKTPIRTNDVQIGFAENGVYRFYNNTLEFVVAYFEEKEADISQKIESSKTNLTLSNSRKDIASDLLIEIELLKSLKNAK